MIKEGLAIHEGFEVGKIYPVKGYHHRMIYIRAIDDSTAVFYSKADDRNFKVKMPQMVMIDEGPRERAIHALVVDEMNRMGYSLNQFAKKLGVNRQTLTRFIKSDRYPNPRMREAFAKHWNLSMDTIEEWSREWV